MQINPDIQSEDFLRPNPHPPHGAVVEAVRLAMREDLLALGDLTAALVGETKTAEFGLVIREDGVIAGQACVQESFFQMEADIEVTWYVSEGSKVAKGTVVAKVAGRLSPILTAERTALNFLGHLSGVASLTAKFVERARSLNSSVRILDTRKTTPGLRALEKAAVRAGGGHNHRSSLSDAVLVKDNHLGQLSITDAVERSKFMWPGRLIEIECDRQEQVEEACRAGATAVLLDNMAPDQVATCVKLVRAMVGDAVLVEVSGGINLDTVQEYASTGVDLISVGALTHSARALDVGLDLYDEISRLDTQACC